MYSRKQFGLTFVVIMLALVAVLCVTAFYFAPKDDPDQRKLLLIPVAVMLITILLFRDLTVTVSEEWITASFGVGLFRKKIALSEVVSCKRVKNSWLTGWGIRYGPGFVLYSISGLEAVELEVRGQKRKVRIGTDEPDELCAAINSRLK
jgi:hypothetical protein